MPATYMIIAEGVKDLDKFGEGLSDDIKWAAQRAINRTVDWTRTLAAKKILEQINFPPSYLNPQKKRLVVAKRASADDLEATIVARHAATSLARFVVGNPKRGSGVSVSVKPGMARYMRKAFLIRLPAGKNVESKGNQGLAIRLKPGEVVRNKNQPRKIASGLYVLYGPSVDQVFRTVREDVAEPSSDHFEKEFLRLLKLEK